MACETLGDAGSPGFETKRRYEKKTNIISTPSLLCRDLDVYLICGYDSKLEFGIENEHRHSVTIVQAECMRESTLQIFKVRIDHTTRPVEGRGGCGGARELSLF